MSSVESGSRIIFEGTYCGDDIIDLERDISEMFDGDMNPRSKIVPQDEHGLLSGTFKVTVEWTPYESE